MEVREKIPEAKEASPSPKMLNRCPPGKDVGGGILDRGGWPEPRREV